MRLSKRFASLLAIALAVRAAPHGCDEELTPTVNIKNGTYNGRHSPEYHQDLFLGVPFAQPPVGNLRFRTPQSLNASWTSSRNATDYSAACVGYGPSQWGYNVSEDCLYLNVIRPSGYEGQKLPVAVWVYGGGFVQGSGVDKRYNLSFIVENSVNIGQPIIAITLNYRLSAWGFPYSNAVQASGDTNLGIRDQRLALHWIQENIAAFGGDPRKVTIWGQSAGGGSVGLQLTAYNGRNDSLFRGAIMESGFPVLTMGMNKSYEAAYTNLTQQAGCNDTADTLQCLREVPFDKLNSVVNTTALSNWTPHIDGDLIQRFPSEQLSDGSFVRIPIIAGVNTDEGTAFSPKGINTTDEFSNALANSGVPSAFAQQILAAYPDASNISTSQNNSNAQILANLGPEFRPGPPYGSQYRRAATYWGDLTIISGRRLTCHSWASFNQTAYCYRFNAIPAWAGPLDGATHFVEVVFAMLNLDGVGYEPVRTPPFQGLGREYTELARLMSKDWVSFVATGNPNDWRGRNGLGVPRWPVYNLDQETKNYVYDANVTSRVEVDDMRTEGIALINGANREVYGR